MEMQDISQHSGVCKLLKERLTTGLGEDIHPLLIEGLRHSRHPTLEDAVHELSRSELLFVALLQALGSKNTAMSREVLKEAEDRCSLRYLSAYLGDKLRVEFNFAREFLACAADFALTLSDSGLVNVPEKTLYFLQHLAEVQKMEPACPETATACPLRHQTLVVQKMESACPELASAWPSRCEADQKIKSASTESGAAGSSRYQVNIAPISAMPAKKSIRPRARRNGEAVERATQALWSAIDLKDSATTQAAIERGADIERRNGGWTPLHWAAFVGNVEVMDVLLRAEANVHAVDNWGDSPLHLAAINGRDEAVARLVVAGANLSALDEQGWTPLQYAADSGNHRTVVLLRTLGAC